MKKKLLISALMAALSFPALAHRSTCNVEVEREWGSLLLNRETSTQWSKVSTTAKIKVSFTRNYGYNRAILTLTPRSPVLPPEANLMDSYMGVAWWDGARIFYRPWTASDGSVIFDIRDHGSNGEPWTAYFIYNFDILEDTPPPGDYLQEVDFECKVLY